MPKLPSVTGKDAVKAFQALGFEVKRIKGSHHMMVKTGHRFVLSVPVHGNERLKKGTLRSLINDAGVTVEEFIDVLN